MLRRIRCRSCGSVFYTHGSIRECQDCTDSYDRSEQAEKDAKGIRDANVRPETAEPQSINPRTGKAKPKAGKKEASE